MLHWSVAFFLIALVAALFGYGGIAEGSAEIGRFLFFAFIVLLAVSFVFRVPAGRRPRRPPV
jgi:uncharacterized membrane protein YtjA (UPF0391 family)